MITAILSSDDESGAMLDPSALASTAMVGSDSTVMPSTAEASAAVPNLEVSEVRIASQGFESFSFVVAALQVEGGFGPAFQNLFASVVPTIRLNSRVVTMAGAAASSGQKPTVFLESGEAVEFDTVVLTLPLKTLVVCCINSYGVFVPFESSLFATANHSMCSRPTMKPHFILGGRFFKSVAHFQ